MMRRAGFSRSTPKNFETSIFRWQQPHDGVQERPRSMEVHKLDLNQVFVGQENKSLTGSNQDISKELEEIR